MGKRVAVVLAGCGVYDGSEIHEASAVLVHLSRGGASVSLEHRCCPDALWDLAGALDPRPSTFTVYSVYNLNLCIILKCRNSCRTNGSSAN